MLGIYCRTSRRESICGIETIDQQKQAGIQFADYNHFDYTIYEDSGKSGYTETSTEDPFLSRPAFKKLLEDIESGKITQVWVWEISRLSRRNKHFASIIETFQKKEIILNVLNSPFDLKNDAIVSMILMQGIWSQTERNEIVARTSRGKKAATDRGQLRHGSFYGYYTDPKTKITYPIKEELETVKAIFEDYLNGFNLREIGKKHFVGENPETTKLLSVVKKVKQILAHEEYTGQNLKIAGRQIEKDFEEEKISELSELAKDDFWVNNNFYTEKIIDRKTWIQAREKLEWTRRSISQNKGKNPRETNKSLASGILKCETCDCNYYFKNLGKHGGTVYQHLRTVDKCTQKPGQIATKKLDTIIDVFYTFFNLLFDNTEYRLKQMKLSVKQNSTEIKRQIAELEKKRNQIQKQIENFNVSMAKGAFLDDNDALVIAVKLVAEHKRQIEQFTNEIKLKNLEIEEAKKQESEISRNEKFKINTIERIQKWFDLREKNSYAELKAMLKETLFGGQVTINSNLITITVNDPEHEILPEIKFIFDIDNDYNVIYPFIEKIIGGNLNKEYTPIESKWIENRQNRIDSFGNRVRDFLKTRPEELEKFYNADFDKLTKEEIDKRKLWEFNFYNEQYLLLAECFNPESLAGDELSNYYGMSEELDRFLDLTDSQDLNSLYLLTNQETLLLGEKYYSTKQVAEIVNKPQSSLRDWARKHNVTSTLSAGHRTLLWTEEDIENYKNRRPQNAGNKGYKFTPEQLAHLSEVRKGRKPSEETLKKRSESLKKYWANATEEKRKKQGSSIAEYNKKVAENGVSEETRKKMSEAKKGKKQTEEQIRKRSESMRRTIATKKDK